MHSCNHVNACSWLTGELKANLKVVVSNHMECEPIAHFFGVPFVCIAQPQASEKERKPRMEGALEAVLLEHDINLIVMARCVPRLTQAVCNR